MSLQSWEETLVSEYIDGPLQNTYTTAKSIFGVDGTDQAAHCKYKVDIFVGFSASNAGNGVQVRQYRLRALN
jgi:hypothetical protein